MNLKIDIHIHSINSFDGAIQIRDLPEISRSKGLDGVAITDHDKFFDEDRAIEVEIYRLDPDPRIGKLCNLTDGNMRKSATCQGKNKPQDNHQQQNAEKPANYIF